MSLWERLHRLKATSTEPRYQPDSPGVRQRLWAQLGTCPICGGDFSGHRYVLLGTHPLGPRQQPHIERLFNALTARRVRELETCRRWNPAGENVELFALACRDGHIAVVAVRTAVESPHLRGILRCQSLGEAASQELHRRLAAERWQPVDDAASAPSGMHG